MKSGRRREPRIEDIDTHPRRFVSISVAAEYLGVHPRTVQRWLELGLLEHQRFPSGVRRVSVTALKSFHVEADKRDTA